MAKLDVELIASIVAFVRSLLRVTPFVTNGGLSGTTTRFHERLTGPPIDAAQYPQEAAAA